MKQICVSAPGKLHLLGEHIVVYERPALLSAVDRRTTVTIAKRKDRNIEIIIPDFSETALLSVDQILEKTITARSIWEEFSKTNNKKLLLPITPTPVDFAIIAIGESLKYFQKDLSCGLTFSLLTKIPLGSGMGSSASLAVAIAGAMCVFFTQKLDRKVINAIAFEIEKKRHGFPSGGDNSACTYGGFLLYQKKDSKELMRHIPLSLSSPMQAYFSLLFTGSPLESTGEMVSFVKDEYLHDKMKMEHIFSSQEVLVENLEIALKQADIQRVKNYIKKGEENLEKMGVVSISTQKIMKELSSIGAAAKICGAGGIKGPTGVLLVIHDNQSSIEKIAKKYNVTYFPIGLGQEGVRLE